MRTAELVPRIGAELLGDASDVAIHDVTHDSRVVGPGSLFACVPGERFDGHDFASAAIDRGAVALLVERSLDLPVPMLRVRSVREALGPAAAAVHGDPSMNLQVIGITGTNGKTTTAALLASILRSAGLATETLGTLSGARTTPEGSDLQRRFRSWVDEGVDAVVMEVSSHALELHRVDGTRFEVGVFLNLSPEHLDFHGTMESYEAAKTRLFTEGLVDRAVVLVDDEAGARVADAATVPVERCSIADAVDLELTADGSRFRWRGVDVDLALPGRFNVANAIAAATAAVACGIDLADIARGLSSLPAVPGRVQPVETGQPFGVLVDYAHTPDALDRVLATTRELIEDGSRLLVVFGAGGDRDRDKRPLMGAAAARWADEIVVTSDNPRSEDPQAIIQAILTGIPTDRRANVVVEADRRRAIALAIGRARPGDLIVIAGKGHETTQETAGSVIEFDDRLVAADAIAELGPDA
ncbi:MAG: UDP-N-acetylmuramoyl-L-alanyl-D-glutamate--2,6-diaminopimelate ligase [Actinomycetota bacterium]